MKFLILVAIFKSVVAVDYYQPEQIHISFGEKVHDIVVTWTTFDKTKESLVEYGMKRFQHKATGSAEKFVDGGEEKRSMYIHRVTLKNLKPNTQYVYRCGSNSGWSAQYRFKTVPKGDRWPPSLAIYGDLGNKNARSLPQLQKETEDGLYDAILHVGDFAYDFDWDNGRVGDEFMRQIEPIAAYVPYMTTPGNHEERYNFSHYKARFSMPGNTENMWYTINLGPLHIISFSSEVFYSQFYDDNSRRIHNTWLRNVLIEANKPENRKKRPWIVTMAHRPMYCNINDRSCDCNSHDSKIRDGKFGVEKLLYDQGVDVEIWAHEHTYSRLWPVYNQTVYNGSYDAPYTNPRAPVHFSTGSAGCQENVDGFTKPRPVWSAFESSDYGFTRLKAYNSTHLYFEQVSINKNGEVIDSFWVIKDSHGPYH